MKPVTIIYPPSTLRGLALDVAVACAGAVGALVDSAIDRVVGPHEVSHPYAARPEPHLDGDSPGQGLNRGNNSSAASMSAGQQRVGDVSDIREAKDRVVEGIDEALAKCAKLKAELQRFKISMSDAIAHEQAEKETARRDVEVHKEHRKVLARDLSALIDGREPTTDLANGVAQRIKRVQAELTEERRAHELAKGVVRAASKHLSFYEVQPGSTPTEEALYSAVAAYGLPVLDVVHELCQCGCPKAWHVEFHAHSKLSNQQEMCGCLKFVPVDTAAAELTAATEHAVIEAARDYALEPNEHHKGRLLYHVCALRCGYPLGEGPDFECKTGASDG